MIAQRKALELARDALRYHTEQTRPITRTQDAIAAIDAALAAPDPTGYPYVDQLISSLLLPLPAMTEQEVGVLHKNCADMLYLLSRKRQQPDPQPVGTVYRYGRNSTGKQWHGIIWRGDVDIPSGSALYDQPAAPAQQDESREQRANRLQPLYDKIVKAKIKTYTAWSDTRKTNGEIDISKCHVASVAEEELQRHIETLYEAALSAPAREISDEVEHYKQAAKTWENEANRLSDRYAKCAAELNALREISDEEILRIMDSMTTKRDSWTKTYLDFAHAVLAAAKEQAK